MDNGESYKIMFWMLLSVIAFIGAVALGLVIARLFGL